MRLGLFDGEEPYVVPLTFVRVEDALYFHSAGEGRKISILRGRPRVCFEVEGESRIEPGEKGCDCTALYVSVIGWGTAAFLDGVEEKTAALAALNRKFGAEEGPFPPELVQRTAVVRLNIDRMTGKANRGHAHGTATRRTL
jgi:hypothetical protein